MPEICVPLKTSPKSKPPSTSRHRRAPLLLLMALAQSGCVAAALPLMPIAMEAGAFDPFENAVDSAAQKQLEEQYRQKYPGVDISDEYALSRAIVEEATGDVQFPSRAVWEANNAKVASATAASAGHSNAAPSPVAAPTISPERSAQDQAWLKKGSTPWVVVAKSWPYDTLNFSSIAPYICGFSQVQYSVNGGDMKNQAFTPCFTSTPEPNPPYLTFPQGSIETVRITMTFADGSRQTRDFQRNEILQR